jgi:hypothetical protein
MIETRFGERLKSISIRGFQSLEKTTTIEFRPITLLYGPNSAGKSAVVDALELAKSILTLDGAAAAFQLEKWWRVDPKTKKYASSLLISLEAYLPWHFYKPSNFLENSEVLSILFQYLEVRGAGPNQLTVTVDIEYFESPFDSISGPRLTYRIEGIQIFRYDPREWCARVNTKHPAFGSNDGIKDFFSAMEGQVAGGSESRLNLFSIEPDGWVSFGVSATQPPPDDGSLDEIFSDTVFYPNDIGMGPLYGILNSNEIGLAHVFKVLVCLFCQDINSAIGKMEGFYRDAPNRPIPRPEDLVFAINAPRSGNGGIFSVISKKIQCGIDFLPYQSLARSLHLSSVHRAENSLRLTDGRDEKPFPRYLNGAVLADGDGISLVELVNHYLRDHLFLDNGYQVAGDSVFFKDLKESLTKSDSYEIADVYYFPAIVQIYLIDQFGRRQDIEDVGSGIAHVLPFLIAFFDSPLLSLQQPELHLHPAAQSALGDVMLEAANRGNYLLIETHSEHLLLRILKRMRNAAKGEIKVGSISVSSEQLAVYYFNPDINGSTVVRRLRVGPDGEFMDRWPRGFFTERDEDLWDE